MSREMLRVIIKSDIHKLTEFIQQGFSLDEITEKERWSYLHRALLLPTKVPSMEMIQYLIDCGVNVNAVDVYGNNVLHYAVQTKNVNLVEVLLKASVDVNHVNVEGVSPLKQTLLEKPFDYSTIHLLLKYGANPEQQTKSGVSVKQYARIIAEDDSVLMRLFG